MTGVAPLYKKIKNYFTAPGLIAAGGITILNH